MLQCQFHPFGCESGREMELQLESWELKTENKALKQCSSLKNKWKTLNYPCTLHKNEKAALRICSVKT